MNVSTTAPGSDPSSEFFAHASKGPGTTQNGTGQDIRRGLRNVLLVLLCVGVPLAWLRDPQLVWQPLLPIPLLFLSPRGVSRVLVFFVAVLFVIGGGVTTYRAGMVVPDWPSTFNENMWTYSYAEMLEAGLEVTLEHAHRLWASGLGLVAIFALVSCFIYRATRTKTLFALAVLLLVSGQGLLGGTRVLENSQNLAFLHGALAQLVFAAIVALAVVCSRTWERTVPTPSKFARGAHWLGPVVTATVYFQIALGAWLRHQGQTAALMVHGTLALFVVVAVLVFAKQLGVASKEELTGPGGSASGSDRRSLGRLQAWLLGSLVAQFTLGVIATFAIYRLSGGMHAEVSVGEVIFATAHVFVGAILFSSTVVGAMYARRALALPAAGTP